MNDENDKPKNDEWGMTMPHMRYEKEKNADKFSDDFLPTPNRSPQQPSDSDWGMTTPNINFSNKSSSSSDFDRTTPNINIPQDAWNNDSPSVNEPPPAEDWDAPPPNINFPQASAPDDWEMNAPNPAKPPTEKKNDWSMPAPVFRVSEGENIDDIKKTAAFKLSDLDGFDKNALNFKSAEPAAPKSFDKISPPSIPDHFAEAPPISQSSPAPQIAEQTVPSEKKKKSKTPLLVGGLLTMLIFAGVFLGGIYFLLFKKPLETASKTAPLVDEKQIEEVPNAAPLTAPTTTETQDLPKQIDYKGAMILVSAGEFTMGSDDGADESKPAHKVVLPAYYIDKTEITNAEYKAFCDATGKSYPPNPHLETEYFTKRPAAPVVGVSFADAEAYAAWAGKRLPTEAEWEKAASWDDLTQTKREFPWGNDFTAKNAAFGTPKISDVGRYSGGASPPGALDMAGNVLEWVDAFFQPYPNSPSANAEFGEKNRVVRGGHFASKSADSLKTTKRIYVSPDVASGEDDEKLIAAIIGFRCAVSANDSRIADVLQTQGK